MKKTLALILAAAFATVSIGAGAADSTDTTPAITKETAKNLETQSGAQYKARGKVAEANEELNKGDCKTSLEGSAKRACEKSAKANAKSDKADAKTMHETEKKAIKDAAK
jgi:hypothetical protein